MSKLGGDFRAVVLAVIAHEALIAQGLRSAYSAAVKDLHVRSEGPSFWRKGRTELLLDNLGIIALGDAYPVRHSQDVAIDGQAGNADPPRG